MSDTQEITEFLQEDEIEKKRVLYRPAVLCAPPAKSRSASRRCTARSGRCRIIKPSDEGLSG